MITKTDVQELIEKARKRSLQRLFDKIIQEARSLVIISEYSPDISAELFAQIALRSHDLDDIEEAKKALELSQQPDARQIEIQAMLANASNDDTATFDILWHNATYLPDSYQKTKALVSIAIYSGKVGLIEIANIKIQSLHNCELKDALKKSLALAKLKERNPDDAEIFTKQFSDAEIQSACVDILSGDRERLGKILDSIHDPVLQVEAYVALHTPNSAWLSDARLKAWHIGDFALNAKAFVIIAKATEQKEDIQKAWKAILKLDSIVEAVTQVTLLAELGKVSHDAFKVARKKALEIRQGRRVRVKALLEIADRLAEVIA